MAANVPGRHVTAAIGTLIIGRALFLVIRAARARANLRHALMEAWAVLVLPAKLPVPLSDIAALLTGGARADEVAPTKHPIRGLAYLCKSVGALQALQGATALAVTLTRGYHSSVNRAPCAPL